MRPLRSRPSITEMTRWFTRSATGSKASLGSQRLQCFQAVGELTPAVQTGRVLTRFCHGAMAFRRAGFSRTASLSFTDLAWKTAPTP